MASKSPLPPSPSSSSRSEPPLDPSSTKKVEDESPLAKDVLSLIESLKKQVAAKRVVSVKNRVEENRQKLVGITNQLWKSSGERRTSGIAGTERSLDLLTKRQKDAIDTHKGVCAGNDDRESNGYHGDDHGSTAVLLGSNVTVKNAVRPIKLPEVKRLPPYTTWIFLDRNQRMTEDQSVLGRRRIYYDQNGGEALICSDSEEELIDEEEDKREFVESEDFILRMTIKEFGLCGAVLESLAECFSRKTSDIKRYETPSNVLYRPDMKLFAMKTMLAGILKMEIHKIIPKLTILFWKRILKRLWTLLTTSFAADVVFLIADYMDALRILSSRLRGNPRGFLLILKMHHVGQIVSDRYFRQKKWPKPRLLLKLMLKTNPLVVLYLGKSLLVEGG